ncbi:HNH endonuclease [Candidatus Parcubacteria bacterium]|nr:HNH endonuclease [Candidatus Parcubacteria bacterium]
MEKIIFTQNGTFRSLNSKMEYIEKDVCENCGEPYLAQKFGIGLFCSRSCSKMGKNNPGKDCYGILNPGYKGGGLVVYNLYKDRLNSYEEVREQKNTGILEARCVYCGQWYVPTSRSVANRLKSINHLNCGEGRLYCSENCKQACPTYNRKMYPKGFKHTTSREVNPYLRQMVLERDNWTCQICGKTIKEAQLHVHHTDPVRQHPMFQNDMDSCITLCKHCHKMVHSVKGCRYVDLQCKTERGYQNEKANHNKTILVISKRE